VGYSVVRIVSPTFYALGKSRIPVMVSAFSVLLNVGLNLVLVRAMGYRGLAFGTSLAALLNAAIQLMLLRREIGGIDGRRVSATLAKIVTASVMMAAAAWTADLALLQILSGDSIVLQGLRVAGSILAAVIVLALAATVLRIQEFEEARDMVIGRLRRSMR
jgi:putative peptidoglycan lipid II flippase